MRKEKEKEKEKDRIARNLIVKADSTNAVNGGRNRKRSHNAMRTNQNRVVRMRVVLCALRCGCACDPHLQRL